MYRFWKNRIIDIYIIKEVLLPYIVGVAIITVIGLSNFLFQLTDLIIIKNIAVDIVLQLLLYQLPAIIVETFPIAVLFATISGMSRLNRENEFNALRLGGISLYRLILPLIIMGIVISAFTFYINEKIVPWTNHEAQNIIRKNILKQSMPDIQDNVFFRGPEGRLFFVNKYDEQAELLEKIVVYELPDDDNYPEIITAQSGKILANKWRLDGGIIHRYDSDGELYQALIFDSMEYEIASEIDSFFGEQRTTSEMNRERLKKDIELFQKSGINVDSLLIDYHLKLSMPLAALIFILIGTPLSLSRKDSRSISIVLTIVIIFAYYLLLSLSQSFGKNSRIDPLLAAWIPNITFGVIGIILLIWREAWQNLLFRVSRFLPLFIVVFFLILSSNSVQAESLNIYKAERLNYNQELGKYELSGEIVGQYSHYHIFADTVTVKTADGPERNLSRVEEINIQDSKFTACDSEDPHYYFDASEVIIYPDDHLVARHVVFRELNGKLPLFYWPYLYISLKDKDQHLVPEIGYSSIRGWFLKTTYYYWYRDSLPGELYMDYYTISGFAGGFKQHFFYEDDLKAYLYLYGQENRTDIPGLFNWQGEISIDNDKSQWNTDTYLKFTDYDNYNYLNGRINLNNYEETWSLNLRTNFASKDYYQSDTNDDKDLDFDISFNKKFTGNWNYHLDLYRDYRYNIEDGLKQRWGGKTYLSRDLGKLDYRLTLERRAPIFTDEDDEEEGVTYYRWPELELNYNPTGPLDFNFQLGRYYEDASRIDGLRGHGQVNYSKSWYLNRNLRFTTNQGFTGRIYDIKDDDSADYYPWFPDTINGYPYLASYSNVNTLYMTIIPGLNWTNKYTYTNYRGQSPFNFDRASLQENIRSTLSYQKGGLNTNLATEYDIYKQEFSPIAARLRWQVNEGFYINMGTSYDIENRLFSDLVLTSKYKDDVWQINNGIRYDINNNILEEIDNQLVFDLNDEWYFELNNSYDNLNKSFDTANLALKKVFHCRSLTFKYDYLNQEYSLEYNINLFPDNKIKVGRSQEDSFMFDIGLDELLKR